ncbi:tRNA pseudouridine synthase A [Halolamina pelagica]|uniref:tRNA pseudouridine synthase A n=1 Tax=Halolamina pelagica TaxID=699431 RepID=A0A0P7GX22_9EURY|nr:tRNA pseudouridine synthase A [Halolamina pelagica]
MRAFRLAYDGRAFYGFQRQPDVPTVEGALLETLAAGGVLDDGETPPGYAAAGRTDAGVSAVAQTVAFEAPDWCTPAALNGRLPGSIRAWAAADVPQGFHATHDASRRTYTYQLHAPDADDAAAVEAANRLAGEHDFHNLTSDESGTVRDVTVGVERDGEFLVVTVGAGGFPGSSSADSSASSPRSPSTASRSRGSTRCWARRRCRAGRACPGCRQSR